MVQTHYVQLQPPYRIIYSGGAMGLQIGTLIVTFIPEQTPSRLGIKSVFPRMTSKTHPVVSYVNKNLKKLSEDFVTRFEGEGGSYSEAVVWDQVDQSEVLTVCYEGQSLSWGDFQHLMDVWNFWSRDEENTWKELGKAKSFARNLLRLGGKIEKPWIDKPRNSRLPQDNTIIIPLSYTDFSEAFEGVGDNLGKKFISSDPQSILPMGAPNPDPKVMQEILGLQNVFYRWLLDIIAPNERIKIRYVVSDTPWPSYYNESEPTKEEMDVLRGIVDKLNR